VPTAPVTVAVALADKLDTLTSFFAIRLPPTGSKDPFALRRAALASLSTIQSSNLRLPLTKLLSIAVRLAKESSQVTASNRHALESGAPVLGSPSLTVLVARNGFDEELAQEVWDVLDFFADRLKVQQREAGVRHDLIDAVFALGGEDDLVRLLARVKALQAFMATEDGANLLAGYKRAANILKQADIAVAPAEAGAGGGSAPTTTAPAFAGATDVDRVLLAALDAAEPAAAAAVTEERFTDAMAALASLRAPIDAFFEGVMVNDPDEAVRAYRLGLLARFTGAVHGVADFSKIEG
jgi:glycyl-tRNA synthetase beta chain